MIQYQSNINQVVTLKIRQLEDLKNPDQMLRSVALGVLPEVRQRVHIEGKDSNNGQIGTYSPSYMAFRSGQTGAKKKYNRSGDPKVILSLTRQMENDLSVVASGSGYGIGFNNPENFRKSQWNEATYGKRIWGLTTEERDLAIIIAEDFINKHFENP